MNLTLPSGHVAPVEAPTLHRLLACGGTISGLCQAVWAHPDVDADTVIKSAPGDAYAVALWAVEEFAASDEAAELQTVCERAGQSPSQRLGVTNRVLAFTLDRDCMLTLHDVQKGH